MRFFRFQGSSFRLRELSPIGLGWSYPCDAYSLGCILVEFYTGVALYQTHDNLEHLAMMEAVMGKMPDRFARAGARSKPEFFKEGSRLDWPKPKASRQSKKDVRATKSLVVVLHLRFLLPFAQFPFTCRMLYHPATRSTNIFWISCGDYLLLIRSTDNCAGSSASSVLFYQCSRRTVAQITTGYLFHSVDHLFAPVTLHTTILFIHLSASHPQSSPWLLLWCFGRGHVQRKSAHSIVSSSIPV